MDKRPRHLFSEFPSELVENIVRLLPTEDRKNAASAARFLLSAVTETNSTLWIRPHPKTGTIFPTKEQAETIAHRATTLRVSEHTPEDRVENILDTISSTRSTWTFLFENDLPSTPTPRHFRNVCRLDVRASPPAGCTFALLQTLTIRDIRSRENEAVDFVTRHAKTIEDLSIASVPKDIAFPVLRKFRGYTMLHETRKSLPKLKELELCHERWSIPSEAAAPSLETVRITNSTTDLVGKYPSTVAFRSHAGVRRLELHADEKTAAYITLTGSFNFSNVTDLRVHCEVPSDLILKHIRHFGNIERLCLDKSESVETVISVLHRNLRRLKSISLCMYDEAHLNYVECQNKAGKCPFERVTFRKCLTFDGQKSCIINGQVRCDFE